MGCGCPDKEKDALIIAEIERRKQDKLKNVPLAFFTHEGSLWNLNDKICQEQIHSIKQVEPGKWEVIYNKEV